MNRLRIIRFILLFQLSYIFIAAITTTPNEFVESKLIQLGISPFWDAELSEIRRWNRMVKTYGLKYTLENFDTESNDSRPHM